MKGTLFSTDFVKDFDGNLRVLEVNTDTQFTTSALGQVDFTGFKNLLVNSNITELHIVYKTMHEDFIELVSKEFADSQISITKTLIGISDVHPPKIEDSDSKFILRLAYDESAIFDSTYCKSSGEFLKLFTDGSASDSAAEYYVNTHEGKIDGLRRVCNSDNMPDLAVKDLENVHAPIQFYKLSGEGTVEEKYEAFLSKIGDNKLVLNYYADDSQAVHKAYRSFNIVYDSDLKIINLVNLEVEALLEKPVNLSVVQELVDVKHYYELTSNYPKLFSLGEVGGVFENEEITDTQGNGVKVESAVIGQSYKALNIEGAPDTDSQEVYRKWFSAGDELNYTSTDSVLVNKIEKDISKKTISHIRIDGKTAFRTSPMQSVLVYDKEDNGYRYKNVYGIVPGRHQLVKLDSTLIDISSNDVEVLEGDYKMYVLDFEEADTFLLHDSEFNLKVIAHNCFPAGTKVLLGNGEYIKIEDIIAEQDELLTYSENTKKFGKGKVGSIRKTTQNSLIRIVTTNGEVKSTPGHKFFCNEEWVPASKLKVGDKLFSKTGELVEIVELEQLSGEFDVYHLIDVKNDHTYFVENILVHNFKETIYCFPKGTEITLGNGDVKNIENITEGDDLLTVNEETNAREPKPVYEVLNPINTALAEITLEDSTKITSTLDHPFYVEGLELKSLYPEKTNAGYNIGKTVSKLEVGDKFIKEDGSLVKVSEIEILAEKETQTYLLRVKDNHNYFANSILVHNK